jgi:hypothetical protein
MAVFICGFPAKAKQNKKKVNKSKMKVRES